MWVQEHSNVLSSQELLQTNGGHSERDSHNATEVANTNFAMEAGKIS
jgi:hypothetical protein